MSAGNSGGWADNAATGGYLYSDDVGMHTNGSPGSYNNSLAVASVDNDGASGEFFSIGDQIVVYNQTTDYKNAPMNTLVGEHEYVLIDGFGTEEDFAAIANVLAGKIAVCSRGSTSFYQKAEAAVKYGAIATIIYNNTTGVINMDLSSYTKTAPWCLRDSGRRRHDEGRCHCHDRRRGCVLPGHLEGRRRPCCQAWQQRVQDHEQLLQLGRSWLPEAQARNHGSWRQHLLRQRCGGWR